MQIQLSMSGTCLGKKYEVVVIPLTVIELQHALLQEWDFIPQEDIRHLILGMPKRRQAIIWTRGHNTLN
nr:unnamed protein product [Callosobruchus chinensis]